MLLCPLAPVRGGMDGDAAVATLPARCLARFTLSHVIECLPTLSHALSPQTLNIPEIVAIGGQSDGKSSLLEAFLGVRRRPSGLQAAPGCGTAGSTWL